ncbi:MAG: UvrB/UvrC motif-containing protein, partial [Euryarchaeota archaeon]|nr:UvrB/UvrC motif-containing protein [Euryarchaeota archaeon]
LEFEKAALLRDKLIELKTTTSRKE